MDRVHHRQVATARVAESGDVCHLGTPQNPQNSVDAAEASLSLNLARHRLAAFGGRMVLYEYKLWELVTGSRGLFEQV